MVHLDLPKTSSNFVRTQAGKCVYGRKFNISLFQTLIYVVFSAGDKSPAKVANRTSSAEFGNKIVHPTKLINFSREKWILLSFPLPRNSLLRFFIRKYWLRGSRLFFSVRYVPAGELGMLPRVKVNTDRGEEMNHFILCS